MITRISITSLLFSLTLVACSSGATDEIVAMAQTDSVTRAFVVPEPDLLPENVAYDPVDSTFYLGSTRKGKIVRIRSNGAIDDFVAPRQDGLWMVIGMKVDAERRVLWVASSMGGNLESLENRDSPRSAGIFQFDLATGRLLRRSILPGGSATHFFNDIALSATGDAFITHMFDEPAIYRVRAGSDQLELLAPLPAESYPNGITFTAAGRLVVATALGLATVDTSTGVHQLIPAVDGVNTRGIDGLYTWEDQLIAVRPDAREVRRYRFASDGQSIVESSVVLSDHADFSNPTTGVVRGDALFVVANSHFPLVRDDGTLPDRSVLTPPVVLRVPLR